MFFVEERFTKAEVLRPTEVISWPWSCWSEASVELSGQGWFLRWSWAATVWWRPCAGRPLAEDHEHVGDPRPRFPHIREGDSGNGWVRWSCGFLVEMGPKVPLHCVHTRPWGLGNSGYTVWLRGYNLSEPQLWNGDNTIQLKGFSRRWNRSEHRAVRVYSNLCHLPCWLKVDTSLVKAGGLDTFY